MPKEASATDKRKNTQHKQKLQKEHKTYTAALQKAKAERAKGGKVSPATRKAGEDSARRYKQASDEYAAFLDQGRYASRANVARESGNTRMKNAEAAFQDLDSGRTNAYNDQQEKLAKARKAYMADAKKDLSPADRAALKAQSVPRMRSLGTQAAALVTSIAALLNSIREQAGGMISGAVGGCSKAVTGGGGVDSGAAALVGPASSLLNMVKSLASNIQDAISDMIAL